jgi:ribosomal protein L28
VPYRNPNLKKTGYYPEVLNHTRTITSANKALKSIDPRTMDPRLKSLLKRSGFLR